MSSSSNDQPVPRSPSSSSSGTLHDPAHSHQPASSKTQYPPSEMDKHTLPLRPWRRAATPFSLIVNHEYPGKGTEEEPFVVDWLPDEKDESGKGSQQEEKKQSKRKSPATDVENPMSWGEGYKWTVIMSVALATLAVALASSCLSGAESSIESTFPNYQTDVYILVTSGFVLGFVIGPLLWAPMSELYGRRLLFIGTYIGFTAFNGGVIASQNIWTLIVLRFFAGVFGSSPLTNAGGTVSDVFSAKQRGLGIAVFASAPFLGPALGPIIGGFLGENAGFRWVAAFIAIFTGVLTIFGFLVIPETYAPKLLKDRAAKLSEVTGKVYRSKAEKDGKVAPKQLFKTALSRPWELLFKEPIVFLLSLYLAIVYGTLYMLFAAFPIVFQQERGWSPGISGLAFLGVLAGFACALLWTVFIENPRYDKKLEAEGGWLPPEQRLVSALIGGCLLPIGLFSFAWTAAPTSIHWSACIILSAPFGMGMVLVFLSIFNYLIDAYLIYAASVLAANSVMRSLFGVAFPLFTTQMYANLGINWASTLVAFLALACTPMPFIFLFYGERVRKMSKKGREADEVGQKMREAAKKQRGEKESA